MLRVCQLRRARLPEFEALGSHSIGILATGEAEPSELERSWEILGALHDALDWRARPLARVHGHAVGEGKRFQRRAASAYFIAICGQRKMMKHGLAK